jgi:hypothetical protein
MMRLPLRARVTLASAASMALILGALSFFVYTRMQAELVRATDAGLRARAEAIASVTGRRDSAGFDAPDSTAGGFTQKPVSLIFSGPGIAKSASCARPAELLDIYPTLVEFCGLPTKGGLEGHSLVPQLKNANAPRPWPAITTHNQGNHSIRSEHWRYIRYADGSEELYDHRTDPNEWTNMVKSAASVEIVREHARWLPKPDVPAVPGSASRVLAKVDGVWTWEGKPINPAEKEP